MIGSTWFPVLKGGTLDQGVETTLKRMNEHLAQNSLRVINIETVHGIQPTSERVYPTGFHAWWEKVEPVGAEPTQAPADQLSCTWRYHEPFFTWSSGCGSSWQFTDGNPKENGMRFCHSCGKPMVVVEDYSESDQ